MKTFYTNIKTVLFACCSLGVVTLISSCGGSGSTTEPGDVIPIGSTINLSMGNYSLSVDVEAQNYGSMLWLSKGSTSGYTGFTFVRQGNEAIFKTSFRYAEGSFIIPGPTIVTPFVHAEITAVLELPDDLSDRSFTSPIYGKIKSYSIIITPSTLANELPGEYTGTGAYSIQPTNLML